MSKHSCSALLFRNLEKGFGAAEVLLVCEPNLSSGEKEGWRWALAGGKCCDNKAGGNCCAETPEETIARECEEETGYTVVPKKLVLTQDKTNPETGARYKRCVFFVTITGGEPLRKRVFAQETPKWFPLNKLPRNLFVSHERFIRGFLLFLLTSGQPTKQKTQR